MNSTGNGTDHRAGNGAEDSAGNGVVSSVERDLQRVIETIYRIDGLIEVTDFQISKNHLDVLLGEDPCPRRERLLVQHEDDQTLVALYLHDEVRLRARMFLSGVAEAFQTPLLDDFCVATEGVSHFVYFTFCGEQLDRPVSKMELELQAEIDKYIILRLLLPVPSAPTPDLLGLLFDRFELVPGLPIDERFRYREANRTARRYARWVERRFRNGKMAEALADARKLYRKPLAEKLEHIETAAA